MPHQHRLTRADIKAFRPEKRLDGTFFSLTLSRKKADAPTRAAFVVSKKVALRAHDRNLIRRRMRAIALEHLSGRIRTGFDLIFMAKNKVKNATFDALRADMENLLRNLSAVARSAIRE